VKTIYITPAGKTATYHIDNYFGSAIQAFGPFCGLVVLTSADMQETLEAGLHGANYPFPVDVVAVKNPFSDTQDYYEILSQLMDTVAGIAGCHTDDKIRCIVNCSGGTTKLTLWMVDLASLLIRLVPTTVFFATFDPKQNKVIYTQRPLLGEKTIDNLFESESESDESNEQNRKNKVSEPEPEPGQ